MSCRTLQLAVLLLGCLVAAETGPRALAQLPCKDYCTEVNDAWDCDRQWTWHFNKIDCRACNHGKKTCIGPLIHEDATCFRLPQETLHVELYSKGTDFCNACALIANEGLVNTYIPSGDLLDDFDHFRMRCGVPS